MVIKVFISGISASKEVKKRQQRSLLILDSCKVEYESIDITEPGMEDQRDYCLQKSKTRGDNKNPIPPQFFNDDEYCGDYEDFDSAVEVNEVLSFLKLENPEASTAEIVLNNDVSAKSDVISTNGVNHKEEEEGETNGNGTEVTKEEEEEEEAEEETEETQETETTREEEPAAPKKPEEEVEEEEEEEYEEEEEEEGEA